jgi:ABC-2 type transport system ATP-binding protein
MIRLKDVAKTYPGGLKAVAGLNLEVPKGQICGFLGPNGAGKTTTMRIITGYMPPTSGSVTVAGHDIFTDPIEARKHIGYLPEHPPLYTDLTTVEYLDFVAKIKSVPRKEIGDRIDYVLGKCSLKDVAGRILGHLSKGYRQRVGLAQALIHNPQVLILDEPTIGLDPRQIREIRDLIQALKGEHTIILSTHILPEVSMICDRAVVIHHGRIVADDELANLGGQGRTEKKMFIRLISPGDDVAKRLFKIDGVTAVEDGDEPGTFLLTVDSEIEAGPNISLEILSQGWGLAELSHPGESLEEVFVRLTAE